MKSQRFAGPLFRSAAVCFVALLSISAFATDVSGDVSGHWTVADSPYVATGSITLPAGQTLLVDPGVEVRFDAGTSFTVNGDLQAQGTPVSPIVWTSDSGTPASGDWVGLSAWPDQAIDWSYWELSYATIGIDLFPPPGGTVLDHCAFAFIPDVAVNAWAWDPASPTTISNCTFDECWHGIWKYDPNGPLSVTGCTFTHAQPVYAAVRIDTLGPLDTFGGNSAPGTLGISGYNGIVVDQMIEPHFNDAGMAYVLGVNGCPGGDVPVILDAGAVLKTQGCLMTSGDLTVNGTAGAPVLVTSINNNAEGGLTYGDGGVPSPDDLGGLYVMGGFFVDHLRMTYLSEPFWISEFSSGGTLAGCTFEEVGGTAVQYDFGGGPGPAVSVEGGTFVDCEVGIRKRMSGSVLSVSNSTFTHSEGVTAAVILDELGPSDAFAGNSASGTGGGLDAIVLDGWDSPTFTDAGMAYVFRTNTGSGSAVLEAGSVLKLDRTVSFDGLTVNGTSGNPAMVTSLLNDGILGDSNGDGASTVPSRDDVGGLSVTGALQAAFLEASYLTEPIVLTAPTVNCMLSGCAFGDAGTQALSISGTSSAGARVTVYGCTFDDCYQGIRKGSAVEALTVDGCTFTHADLDDYSIVVENLTGSDSFANLASTGTGRNGIAVAGWTDARFTKAGIPYVWGGGSGSGDLTFDAGSILKFYDAAASMGIEADTITVNGTEPDPVFITSFFNDAVGGDTDGNGAVPGPAPGNLGGLIPQASLTAEFLVSDYLHQPIQIWGNAGTYNVSQSSFSNSGEAAVDYIGMGGPYTAQVSVADSDFQNCWIGVRKSAGCSLSVEQCNFSHDQAVDTALRIHALGPGDCFSGNGASGSGGGWDGIHVASLAANARFSADSMAYIITGALAGILSFDPGAILKFDTAGSLDITGASLNPGGGRLLFTSLADDRAAGDTNGDGSASLPAPGDWPGLTCTSGSLSRTGIRYAATGIDLQAGGTGSLDLAQSVFFRNSTGLSIVSGAVPAAVDESLFYRCDTGLANAGAAGSRVSTTAFAGCATGVSNASSSSLKLGDDALADPLDVGHNAFFCNTVDIHSDGDPILAQNNWWSADPATSGRITGTGTVVYDPQLVNPVLQSALSDIRLSKVITGPPAIDAVAIHPTPIPDTEETDALCECSIYRGGDPSSPLGDLIATGTFGNGQTLEDSSYEATTSGDLLFYRLVPEKE